MDTKLSDELLQECYKASAEIVATYGEKYLPIFMRFHDEVNKRNAQNSLIGIARAIASS